MLKEGSRRWKEVLKIGCGGYYDPDGEFECEHDYEWDCGYCPCFITYQRLKWQEKLSGKSETINTKFDIDIDDILRKNK